MSGRGKGGAFLFFTFYFFNYLYRLTIKQISDSFLSSSRCPKLKNYGITKKVTQ